jgi:hypothetical protein
MLQPLRIPAGWVVVLNLFNELDPTPAALLYEDLLRLANPGTNRLVDVGWYGPRPPDPAGTFAVCVHEGGLPGRSLAEFLSRDRLEVVAEVERLLVGHGK